MLFLPWTPYTLKVPPKNLAPPLIFEHFPGPPREFFKKNLAPPLRLGGGWCHGNVRLRQHSSIQIWLLEYQFFKILERSKFEYTLKNLWLWTFSIDLLKWLLHIQVFASTKKEFVRKKYKSVQIWVHLSYRLRPFFEFRILKIQIMVAILLSLI